MLRLYTRDGCRIPPFGTWIDFSFFICSRCRHFFCLLQLRLRFSQKVRTKEINAFESGRLNTFILQKASCDTHFAINLKPSYFNVQLCVSIWALLILWHIDFYFILNGKRSGMFNDEEFVQFNSPNTVFQRISSWISVSSRQMCLIEREK